MNKLNCKVKLGLDVTGGGAASRKTPKLEDHLNPINNHKSPTICLPDKKLWFYDSSESEKSIGCQDCKLKNAS